MISLLVNGKKINIDADPEMPLLWALRDRAELTGTKLGCGIGSCGACTVQLDERTVRSCTTPVKDAIGKKITTIEGVAANRVGRAVQAAWQELDVVQCGFCQPGQIVSATALLARNPRPNDAQIDAAMSRNVCRCATYVRIRAAIHNAAERLAKA
jgi:isoquinoline 1-oxidoreductase alpha subunit